MTRFEMKPEHALNYLLGGKATITVQNVHPKHINKSQFTFNVWWSRSRRFLRVYYYSVKLGFIDPRKPSFHPTADDLYDEQPLQVFQYIWDHITAGTMHKNIRLYHIGECGRCKRPLTDAISLETGIGPECRKKLGIQILKPDTHGNDIS